MESIRTPYKQDTYGNEILTRVVWSRSVESSTHHKRPLALVFHAGGLVGGSADIIPQPQIDFLCSSGFVVVIPNYRLIPQVTGKQAFGDCEEAFDWALKELTSIMQQQHAVEVDVQKAVALGHSSGGTIVLHLASIHPTQLKAVLSFYPFVFVADESTAAHHPSGFFGKDAAAGLSEEEMKVLCPPGLQVSEAPLSVPTHPRSKFTRHVFATGTWMANVQPDGDFEAVDPLSRIDNGGLWPAVRFVHGSEDTVPGRSVELMERAVKVLNDKGVKEVDLEVLEGGKHLFDHQVIVGDMGEDGKEVVRRALEWLVGHV